MKDAPADWDEKYLNVLYLKCCANKLLPMIRTKRTAKSVWEMLQKKYGSKLQANFNLLCDRLIQMQCSEAEKLNNFCARFEVVVTDLEDAGNELSDEGKSYLMRAMPKKYRHVGVVMENIPNQLLNDVVAAQYTPRAFRVYALTIWNQNGPSRVPACY